MKLVEVSKNQRFQLSTEDPTKFNARDMAILSQRGGITISVGDITRAEYIGKNGRYHIYKVAYTFDVGDGRGGGMDIHRLHDNPESLPGFDPTIDPLKPNEDFLYVEKDIMHDNRWRVDARFNL